MPSTFDPEVLRSAYDRGRLVPFLGSGVSIPACTDWAGFVQKLEELADIDQESSTGRPSPTRLIERAATAMHALRRQGEPSISEAIRAAVYKTPSPRIPASTRALAKIEWPMVCTTNYDELYVAALHHAWEECQAQERPIHDRKRIEVLGRSEVDCRSILHQLAFPTRRVLWALQGFLRPTEDIRKIIEPQDRLGDLEGELVVGHAEYRRAAHAAPYFRRVFAEVFRSRSFLFVGAGLSEPYFRALFDEVIELTGEPVRPHYAFVSEGAVDPDFMKREYHIFCYCYPKGNFDQIERWIETFGSFLGPERRVHQISWSYGVYTSSRPESSSGRASLSFKVVRSTLPSINHVRSGDAIAISCGRDRSRAAYGEHGKPLPGPVGAEALNLSDDPEGYVWLGEWLVKWKTAPHAFGIVARTEKGDERTPRAIRDAFKAFLFHLHDRGYHAAHVQLLAAGVYRQFAPWVSLAQMARAYGEWARDLRETPPPVEVTVYVEDAGVIALLQGGFLDLSEELDGGRLRISVESIDTRGSSARYYELVRADAQLSTLAELAHSDGTELLSCTPKAKYSDEAVRFSKVRKLTFRDFGLVSGSTLHVDCRKPESMLDRLLKVGPLFRPQARKPVSSETPR